MKTIIFIAAALIVAVSCDVSHIGQGWSKDESGYNYPKAVSTFDEIVEEEIIPEVEIIPEIQVAEFEPKAVEEVANDYLPPVANDYLPPAEATAEARKRRAQQAKRQIPGKRIYRRVYKKL